MKYTRRTALKIAGASLLPFAAASRLTEPVVGDPIKRTGPHHFQLGLAAYSFRNHFKFMKGKPQTPAGSKSIDMFEFIDYCAANHVAGAELTSYFFPPDADESYFLRVKRHAFTHGITICGTAIGNDFASGDAEKTKREITAAKQWIRSASQMGAPHIRLFGGKASQFAKSPDRINQAIEALQTCAQFAGEHGIFIGVENHGALTAEQMLTIMKGVDSQWVGMNLDTGNFFTDAPYNDLATCAPYAVNVQAKVKMKKPDGTKYDADLKRIGQILKNSNYQGFVVLEYEEEDAFDNVAGCLETLRSAIA